MRDRLILAVFDIETRHAFERRPTFDEGLAVGVIRWVQVQRHGAGQVTSGTIAENVYWSALAMVDDLLRPWHHAIVAWNGRDFDVPELVHACIPPGPPGPYQVRATPAAVAAVARHLWRAGQRSWPTVALSTEPALRRPLGLLDRLGAALLDRAMLGVRVAGQEHRAVGDWMARHQGYSAVVPAGVAGILHDRQGLQRRLEARLFDPLAELAGTLDHPRPAHLSWAAEALDCQAYEFEGEVLDHARLPELWQRGLVWVVADACRSDVEALTRVVHAGLFGGSAARLFFDHLHETYQGQPRGRAAACRIDQVGALHRYQVPTSTWWDTLNTIADRGANDDPT